MCSWLSFWGPSHGSDSGSGKVQVLDRALDTGMFEQEATLPLGGVQTQGVQSSQ